LVKISEL